MLDKMLHYTSTQRMVLVFTSMADISTFKHECICRDFYIDRDLLSLVGSFTEAQLSIAQTKYHAVVNREIMPDYN